jgi:DNA-binding GntR family transcriptional regulator
MKPEPSVSASEYAYRALRAKIIALELPPFANAGEQAMADMLGVSRTPIREALSRLSMEGLVDIYSRRGVVVAPIRMQAVESAQFVREVLEVAIVREAATRPDGHTQLSIRQAVEEQVLAVDTGDRALFFEADEKMHRQFCRMAGRLPIWAQIGDAKKHLDRLRRLSVQTIDLSMLLADHRLIVEGIEAGDADAAADAMRLHLRRVLGDVGGIRQRFPHYFDAEDEPVTPTEETV